MILFSFTYAACVGPCAITDQATPCAKVAQPLPPSAHILLWPPVSDELPPRSTWCDVQLQKGRPAKVKE